MRRLPLGFVGVNAGNHIGQYRILRTLGAGGMGTVYLGEHILLGRRAAIKTLLPALLMQPAIVERFFTEARATSAISDPGVVQVFDFGYHVDGTAYIVMELLEGESLAARIDRLGRLPAGEALRITRQVAGALGAAHERAIVHRDLKPENVFLVRDAEAQGGERAKLLDFGICKLGAEDGLITQSGTTLGTPVYMSPEQCHGAGKVDHRADIYALGCVLFHMVVGRPPFQAEGVGAYLVAHLQTAPPVPSDLVPAIPHGIDALVARCLAKSPDDRFGSMAEMQAAIERVLAHLSAPRLLIVDTPPPVTAALGLGFQSAYNVNLGTHVPTQGAPALVPGPPATTLRGATGELPEAAWPARHGGARVMLAIVGVAAVVTALIATRPLDAGPAAAPRPSIDEAIVTAATSLPVTAGSPPPVARPVAVSPAPVARPLAAAPVIAVVRPRPRPPAPGRATVRGPRAVSPSRPARRPAVRTSPRAASPGPVTPPVAVAPPGTPPAPKADDLYDTR